MNYSAARDVLAEFRVLVRQYQVATATGWREEGFAPRYLHIDGAWRDHVMYAITAEEIPRRT